MTLADKKIQVNRSMIRKTFLRRGLPYASELALKNVADMKKIIEWNIRHNLLLYRMSSDMFPWMSEYELRDLPDYTSIRNCLQQIGNMVRKHNLRLTFHPGPFNVLATMNENVLRKTIKELRQHGEIMDMLELPRSPFAKINIHLGGAYGNKPEAIERFIRNVRLLPDSARSRLTVENDDKVNMFSVKDILRIHEVSGIPVVFDYLHHRFCNGGLTEREAMLLACSTWPNDIAPVVHYSSSRKSFEDPQAAEAAHADYVYEKINLYGCRADIMIEAKAKEIATLRFIRECKTGGC